MHAPSSEPAGHFDAVVVGSGFGGSVTAFRLAEAGHARLPARARQAVPAGLVSPQPAGRWAATSGIRARACTGSSTSGSSAASAGSSRAGSAAARSSTRTSLIRKDRSTFVQEDGREYWPVTYDDLEPHYERTRQMLERGAVPLRPRAVRPHPEDEAPSRRGARARARVVPAQARRHVRPGRRRPAAGRADPRRAREPPRPHPLRRAGSAASATSAATSAASTRSTSTTSRSRSSATAPTSGRAARRRRSRRASGGGYAVGYVDHSQAVEGERRRAPLRPDDLTADRLVLSPECSARRTSCCKTATTSRLSRPARNALLRQRRPAHVRDEGPRDRERRAARIGIEPGYGPVITSTIRVKDAARGRPRRAFYIQDGGLPADRQLDGRGELPACRDRARASASLRRLAQALAPDRRPQRHRARARTRSSARRTLSSTSMPLFCMGRDIPDGNMTLTDDGSARRRLEQAPLEPVFEDMRRTGREIARRRSTRSSRTTRPGTSAAW